MKTGHLFTGAALLAACAGAALAQGGGAVDVRAAMQQQVNPAILAIWDIGNNAMNDEGGIDPALMDDAKWASLAEAAGNLAEASRHMAAGDSFHAAGADNMEVAEGEISMADVQRFLDGDPEGFRALATAQADHADRLLAAANARDVAAAGELVAGVDGVCEDCHSRFWYPES